MGRSLSGAWALSGLLVCACQSNRALDPPAVPESAHSALILVGESGQPAQLSGGAIVAGVPAFPALHARPDANIEIAFLRCTLEYYGLPAGEMPIANEGRALPNPISAFAAAFADEPAAWSPIAPSAAVIQQLQVAVPAPDVCPRYASDPLYLPGSAAGDGNVLVPLMEGRVLVGSDRGEYYVVEGGSAVRLTELSTTTPSAAGFSPDGVDIWLFGKHGEIVRGSLAGGFGSVSGLSAGQQDVGELRVAGAHQGPLEMYVVTHSDILERYADGAWSVLVRGTDVRDRPSVAFVGPGHAIAVGVTQNMVTRYRDGVITHERVLEEGLDDTLHQVAVVPGLGEVAVTQTTHAYLSDGAGHWSLLAVAGGVTADAILPLPDGFLIGTLNGGAFAYDVRTGFCPIQVVAPNEVSQLAQSGDQILALTDFQEAMGSDAVSVSFIRRLNSNPSCEGP